MSSRHSSGCTCATYHRSHRTYIRLSQLDSSLNDLGKIDVVYNGSISSGNTITTENLSKYKTLIFTGTTSSSYIAQGGSLILLYDHFKSKLKVQFIISSSDSMIFTYLSDTSIMINNVAGITNLIIYGVK